MRRDEVFKAIQFDSPSRVPVYLFNCDQDRSDIVAIDVQRHFMGKNPYRSEWGFTWNRIDETMGQPNRRLIDCPDSLNSLVLPDPDDPQRFQDVPAFTQLYPDRFRLASLSLSGFTTMSFLRGFDDLMVDMVDRPDFVDALADRVFDFEEQIIRRLSQYQFDAVAFFDDWGTQKGMLISPATWRRFFKPRYQHQFALAHSLGLKVYFHSCGYYPQIIPDFIETGVDMLNISQPNLYSISDLGQKYGGKVCFVCPVSYQTTSISGTRADIFRDVQALVDHLGCFKGGLIGYVEEYHTMGMSAANYRACVDAFDTLGVYAA